MHAKRFLIILLIQVGCISCGTDKNLGDQASTKVGMQDIQEILEANGGTPKNLIVTLANVLSKNNLTAPQLFSHLNSVLTLYCEGRCQIQKTTTKGEK